ncbi:hypothetical protein BJ165DRAFT_1532488 [Panaeolus papilionaceus]|nr:hypothetical protein BJ165DRAFT_1532478 [Panaeolus papilionaceus]KAF9037094.1 hypothetical protein BJ165DRAFT_1532488 [Panaeolus papilionaceus]
MPQLMILHPQVLCQGRPLLPRFPFDFDSGFGRLSHRGVRLLPTTSFEHIQLSDPLELVIGASAFPADSSGYEGLQLKGPKEELGRVFRLTQLSERSFEILFIVEWDVMDCCLLAGMLKDPSFRQALSRVFEFVLQEGGEAEFLLPEETVPILIFSASPYTLTASSNCAPRLHAYYRSTLPGCRRKDR